MCSSMNFLKIRIIFESQNFANFWGPELVRSILARNLLIYIYLHCVRRLSWSATTLDTLTSTHQKEKVLLRLAAAALHNAHCSKMVSFVQKIFQVLNRLHWMSPERAKRPRNLLFTFSNWYYKKDCKNKKNQSAN